MKYSRNQINKAGQILITAKSIEEVDKALSLINDWRTHHLYPLEELKNVISDLFDKNSIEPILISQRLKRLSSIQYKLDLNPDMRLGGMQDIGGLRVVLGEMEFIDNAYDLLGSNIGNFELQRITDYIEKPKDSGYRSIHFIYKYISDKEIYNGLKFELQIRTKLQHGWATALETVDIHTKSALKSGQGDDNWLDFFKIISSLFAHKEKSATLNEHKEIELTELMRIYYRKNKSKKNLVLLSAFQVSNKSIDDIDIIPDYYLLNIDIVKRSLSIHTYTKEEFNEATQKYYEIENSIEQNKQVVVLVSTDSYKSLREAYPSYFSDLSDFIYSLSTVEENCQRLGLT